MKPGCSLIAYLHGKPEKRNELLAVLSAFVAPTRAEPGCVEYHLHISQDDPNLFIFYKNWRSRTDLDAHLEQPLLKAFFARRMDLLEKDVEMQFIAMESPYEVREGMPQ